MKTTLKTFIGIVVISTIILFGKPVDIDLLHNVKESNEMKEKIKQMAFYECSYSDFSPDSVTVHEDPEEKNCYYIRFGSLTLGEHFGFTYYYWFDSNINMLYLCTMNRESNAPNEQTIAEIIDKRGDHGRKILGYHEDKFHWEDVIAIAQAYCTKGYGEISYGHLSGIEFLPPEVAESQPREIIEIWNMGGRVGIEPPWETYRTGGGLIGKYEFNGLTGELFLQCTDYHFYRGCHEDLNQLIKQFDRENIPILKYRDYTEKEIDYWSKKTIECKDQTVFYVSYDPIYTNCFFISMADNEMELYQTNNIEDTKSRVVYWLDACNYKLYLVDQTDPYDQKKKGRELVREINREEMEKRIKEMYDNTKV